MIFGKKQILMATLVLALGTAVYLHSTFDLGKSLIDKNDPNTITQTNIDIGQEVTESNETEQTKEKNYGDTQFVNADIAGESTKDVLLTSDDYFLDAQLNRRQTRDAVIESLQKIINSQTTSDEEKTTAINNSTDLAMIMETESNIENLVKAKGFNECMAYIDNGTANIVVKTPGLLASEAAQIKDIIVSESGISAHNIVVLEVQ